MDKNLCSYAKSLTVALFVIALLLLVSYKYNRNDYYQDKETEDYIAELEAKVDWYEKELTRLYSEQDIDISYYSVD